MRGQTTIGTSRKKGLLKNQKVPYTSKAKVFKLPEEEE